MPSHKMKDGKENATGYMFLDALGYCDNPDCNKVASRPVMARVDESAYAPSICEHCGQGTVHFEKLKIHHYSPRTTEDNKIPKPLLWILRIILICLLFLAGVALYAGVRLQREYTVKEMSSALEASSEKSVSEILVFFYDAGIKERTLSKYLGASPFTLRRILSGQSLATPSFEANLRGLYSDYLLLHSNILFHIKYALRKTDQWYPFINPLQELEVIPEK